MAQSEVCIKWNGKEINIQLAGEDTVATLKHRLEEETRVLAKRQKVYGMKVVSTGASCKCA